MFAQSSTHSDQAKQPAWPFNSALCLMNKKEAIEKIQNSIADGVQVITPKGDTYESFVNKQAEKLLAHVIEPVVVNITSTCAPEGDYEKYKNTKVWAIANMNDSWLLTIETENDFALALANYRKV